MPSKRLVTITLSEAQESAVQQQDWSEEPCMRGAWDGERKLRFYPEHRDALFSELTEASNGEDAFAEVATERGDKDIAKMARKASRSLQVLASKVLKKSARSE